MAGAYPKTGGPYAYARKAFGDFVGFQTAWGYWIAVWAGNAAITVAFVGYLAHFWHALGDDKVLAACVGVATIWLLTAMSTARTRTCPTPPNPPSTPPEGIERAARAGLRRRSGPPLTTGPRGGGPVTAHGPPPRRPGAAARRFFGHSKITSSKYSVPIRPRIIFLHETVARPEQETDSVRLSRSAGPGRDPVFRTSAVPLRRHSVHAPSRWPSARRPVGSPPSLGPWRGCGRSHLDIVRALSAGLDRGRTEVAFWQNAPDGR
ncbi:amino acid permease [Actinomadura physcomitrii]|uniref:amino acid permease n=1 Tax=Actinomadura physcomitrii TaxID=2650748 RepID=UPI001925142C